MQFSEWKQYFQSNSKHFEDINFNGADLMSESDKRELTSSLQQFQKGESSEGKNLYAFAKTFPDPEYLQCIRLFIPEEQKHAAVLARLMKKNEIPLIKTHWVDGVFRWLRKLSGIENTVRILLIAEVVAKVYYKILYRATTSQLLRNICLQILRDEKQHILFQCDALKLLYQSKSRFAKFKIRQVQRILICGTIIIVAFHHRKVIRRGDYSLLRFATETLSVFLKTETIIYEQNAVTKKQVVSIA